MKNACLFYILKCRHQGVISVYKTNFRHFYIQRSLPEVGDEVFFLTIKKKFPIKLCLSLPIDALAFVWVKTFLSHGCEKDKGLCNYSHDIHLLSLKHILFFSFLEQFGTIRVNCRSPDSIKSNGSNKKSGEAL